jgi:hypothetical protein
MSGEASDPARAVEQSPPLQHAPIPDIHIPKFQKTHLIRGRLRAAMKWILLSLLALPDAITRRKRRYLIVLGHMRAGSSLLTNIIANSREAAGYGETFTVYTSSWSYRLLVARIRLSLIRRGRFRVSAPLIVDKALHSPLTPRIEVLISDATRIVFLIREGVRAVRSMMHEFEMSEQVAADYYVARVAELSGIAKALHARARPMMLLTYEELLEDSEAALRRLSEFAGLKEPLTSRFQPRWNAGEPGIGDPSGRVRAGEILAKERPLDAVLSPETAERLRVAHRDALDALTRLCR